MHHKPDPARQVDPRHAPHLDNSTADRSNTPTSKSIVITVAPTLDADAAAAELRRNAQEASSQPPALFP